MSDNKSNNILDTPISKAPVVPTTEVEPVSNNFISSIEPSLEPSYVLNFDVERMHNGNMRYHISKVNGDIVLEIFGQLTPAELATLRDNLSRAIEQWN